MDVSFRGVRAAPLRPLDVSRGHWLATYFTERAFLAAGVEGEAGEREGETGHRAVQRNNLPSRDKMYVFISISLTHNARFGLGQLNRLLHLKAKAKSQGFQYVHAHAETKDTR